MLRYKRVSDERFNAKSVGFDNESCVLVKDKASINFYSRNRYRLLSHYCLLLRLATR